MPRRPVLGVLSILAYLGCLYGATLAQASVVDVTVSANKPQDVQGRYLVDIKDPLATLTVWGQVKPGVAQAGNGIFGWDVDLRVSDPSVLQILAATLVRDNIWTRQAATSSSGTAQSWGIDAIYDTGENGSGLGLGARVPLFTVQVAGLAQGAATVTVEPDTTSGADFVTWLNQTGGDYGQASQAFMVTPEPCTLGLVLLGAAAILRGCRRERAA